MRVKPGKRFHRIMMSLCLSAVLLLIGGAVAQDAPQQQAPEQPKPDFPPIQEVVKDAQKMEGFLNLYRDKEMLFAEIPESIMEKPFLLSMSVKRGVGQGFIISGMTWSHSIYYWKLADKRVFLMEKNVRHRASAGTPIAHAVESDFSDSVIASLPIRGQTGPVYLVSLNDFLFSDYAAVASALTRSFGGQYALDTSRTTWGKVRTFPQNVEIEVAATFSGAGMTDHRTIVDSRFVPVTMYYSFSAMPQTGYRPRIADNRIGYFMTVSKDYSLRTPREPFVRYINRWNIEKADPSAEVSPPKKPVVFYIEKSVPYEYRPAVREGILLWNKAFERAGIINALEVRFQEDDADWEAEDIRYNTIRWATGEIGYAIGPSRANPLTGEIFNADIIIDASMVQHYLTRFAWYSEAPEAPPEDLPVEATLHMSPEEYWKYLNALTSETYDSISLIALHEQQRNRVLREQFTIAAAAIAAQASDNREEQSRDFIYQAVCELTAHEVGHTLGLMHNFKASAMISLDTLHDKEAIAKTGLSGSIMDYLPTNVAPPGVEQGYWASPTLGEYDYLAIEYGYTHINAGSPEAELPELQKIAARASEPPFLFGDDYDIRSNLDPLTAQWDLGDDLLGFAQQRVAAMAHLMKGVVERVTPEGESYDLARQAYLSMLGDMQRAMYVAARYVGGIYVNRVFRGDPGERRVFEPVDAAKQREALQFAAETAFKDETYVIEPETLELLAPNTWPHWGSTRQSPLAVPMHRAVLQGQMRILHHLFTPDVLGRLVDNELYLPSDADRLTVIELYNVINNSIWSELDAETTGSQWSTQNPFISSTRRNLQKAFTENILLPHVLEPSSGLPTDVRSAAWTNLNMLKGKLDSVLEKVDSNADVSLDAVSDAHLREWKARIDKAVEAAFTAAP